MKMQPLRVTEHAASLLFAEDISHIQARNSFLTYLTMAILSPLGTTNLYAFVQLLWNYRSYTLQITHSSSLKRS